MSKQVFTQVIRGAHAWVEQAEKALDEAIAKSGPDTPVGWGPLTAYNLPMSYSLMGLEAKTLGDLRPQIHRLGFLKGLVRLRGVVILPGFADLAGNPGARCPVTRTVV